MASLSATLVVLALVLSSISSVYASPFRVVRESAKRDDIPTLTDSQVAAFRPYTYFASAAYCTPNTTINWTCGSHCEENSGFMPTASGGDGNETQYWYVGYDPTLDTVLVAHQGTASMYVFFLKYAIHLSLSYKFSIADFIDVDFFLESLDPVLFPGISPSIKAHNGFAGAHARAARAVLAAAAQTLAAHAGASVTTVGHSLGAALALLDAVFLPLHLPPGTALRFVGYGLPRVGNAAFADYVGARAHGADVTHVNNRRDPVPIVPGRALGFRHPAGEVHIQASGAWDACPGRDDPSELCIVGDVPTLLSSDVSDHTGPYDGILMGCT
ncbi:lipase [Phellopilus nigrolimitatus]|nr:lipase [Phellopilus nigrolimitatus]